MASPSEPAALSDAWRALVRTIVGEPELTSAEVAARSGVELEQARRLWRALGFPPAAEDERIFAQSDVAILQGVHRLLADQGNSLDAVLQLTRVTGQALARVAEAQVAANAERLKVLHDEGFAQGDEAKAAVDEVSAAVLNLEPFLAYVWRRHLLASLVRFAATAAASPGAGNVLAVGFADLVGFTAISQQMDESELAAMVDRFEALAYEHIPERGGRVIKMIGDEVMFAADDAALAAEIALALREAYAGDEELPEVRVGLAIGPTLSWEGDLIGPTVNLASRLVNIARPGTVLISDELATQLQALPAVAVRRLRSIRLKGLGRVRVWALQRSTPVAPPERRRRFSRG